MVVRICSLKNSVLGEFQKMETLQIEPEHSHLLSQANLYGTDPKERTWTSAHKKVSIKANNNED